MGSYKVYYKFCCLHRPRLLPVGQSRWLHWARSFFQHSQHQRNSLLAERSLQPCQLYKYPWGRQHGTSVSREAVLLWCRQCWMNESGRCGNYGLNARFAFSLCLFDKDWACAQMPCASIRIKKKHYATYSSEMKQFTKFIFALRTSTEYRLEYKRERWRAFFNHLGFIWHFLRSHPAGIPSSNATYEYVLIRSCSNAKKPKQILSFNCSRGIFLMNRLKSKWNFYLHHVGACFNRDNTLRKYFVAASSAVYYNFMRCTSCITICILLSCWHSITHSAL